MSTNSDRLRRITYKSRFGAGILVWRGEVLVACGLPASGVGKGSEPRTPAEKKLVRQLEGYFAGKKTAFNLSAIQIDCSRWTLFQSRIAEALVAIPYGETISYAELADAAGHPRASRAVGNCMAANPYPLIIPCHRVVRSDGSPGKFSAGSEWKARLLRLEGLTIPE